MMLAKILVGTLISINVLFWAYTFYGVSMIVIDVNNSEARTEELVAPLSDVLAVHTATAPEPLAIRELSVLSSASDAATTQAAVSRADFVAAVKNTNHDWIMNITYTFQWQGGETMPEQWILLPGEETYLVAIGFPVSGLPSSAELVADIAWERVKDQSILVRPQDALSGISVQTFESQSRSGITDISVVVGNASRYTIVTPSLVLVATYANGEVAAVWTQKPDAIESGSSITIQRRFLHTISGVHMVSAYLTIDAFNESTYELRGSGVTPF